MIHGDTGVGYIDTHGDTGVEYMIHGDTGVGYIDTWEYRSRIHDTW